MRREIHALSRLGVDVVRVAARPFSGPLVELEDIAEQSKTIYLASSFTHAVMSLCLVAATSPTRFIRAVLNAISLGSQTKSGVWKYFLYIGEASVLLRSARNCCHIHANFGNATSIATLCRILGGPQVSLRIHGPEEFNDFTSPEWRWKVSHAAFVAPISEYGLGRILASLPTQQHAKIKLLRCGIDLSFFKEIGDSIGSIPAAYRIICVARLEPRKGHETLLNAISVLSQEGFVVSLKLIGDGTLRKDLENHSRDLSISESVEFLGWQSEAEVAKEIRSARLMVLPSYAEGLPIVLMESLALGRPAVSTSVMGIPELIHHGLTGWLVPPGDVQSLARTLKQALLTANSELGKMATMGHLLVSKHHDANKLMKELVLHISES